MLKVNMQRGSHHLVVVLVSMALIIGIVGFLGVKAYQKESNAAPACKGVYYKNAKIKGHGPCWSAKGAYLVNYGKGGNKVQHVKNVKNKQSSRMAYPNRMIVVSGYWKICDDMAFAGDHCSNSLGKGSHDICKPRIRHEGAFARPNHVFCEKKDIYIVKVR